jgi:threonine-phosphate decarboxylase
MSDARPAHGGQLRQISERFHIPAAALMDFSANINPDGPPPAVLSTLRSSLDDPAVLTQYPDLEQSELKQCIAQYVGVDAGNVAVANGFVPLLEAAVAALKVRSCLLPVPAFVEYRRSLAQAGVAIEPHVLSADANFRYPLEAWTRSLAAGGHDAVLLANPQNPSGVLTDKQVLLPFIAACARQNVTVLLDEAFIDYAPMHSLAAEIERFPNLIVFRSVTKFHAIAGLRVAYAVAAQRVAAALTGHLPPWPITTLASRAASAALAERSYAEQARVNNHRRRSRLQAGLAALNLLPYPAAANFLLFRLPSHVAADSFWSRMIVDHHIVLRNCSNYEALPPHHFRTAVQTERWNDLLLATLAACLQSDPPPQQLPGARQSRI